jgi:hypothetical protein
MWLAAPFMIGITLAVALGFVAAVGFVVYRQAPAEPRRTTSRWIFPTALKGLVFPFLLWALFNCGFFGLIQPLMPSVQEAQNAKEGMLWPFLLVSFTGMFAIASYWAAMALGVLTYTSVSSLAADARSAFRGYCITWTCVTALPALLIFWSGGWVTLGMALTLLLLPIAAYMPEVAKSLEMPPMYARAIAKIKFGKYSEAEWEIIRQLERHPNDFNGWIMLAKIYAEEYRDLAEAEQTVLEVCNQPNITPSEISVALQKLADWQLDIGDDPDAARRSLFAVCNRLPGTHLAHMAELRIRSLPRSREELLEQRENRPVALPPLSDSAQVLGGQRGPAMPRERATALVRQLNTQLQKQPEDNAAREKMARLLAEHLDQLDAGIAQLRYLMARRDALPEKRAEWLGCIAGWHLHNGDNAEATEGVLRELVRDFPDSPEGKFGARRLAELTQKNSAPPPLPKGRIRVTFERPTE